MNETFYIYYSKCIEDVKYEFIVKAIPMKGVRGIKKLRNWHIKAWCAFYKECIYFYLNYNCYINVKIIYLKEIYYNGKKEDNKRLLSS